ncbi:MAG: DUF3288 family protein [Microcystaceae cyanobacterium]
MPQEQKHPQEKQDREVVNRLLQGQPTEYNLVELARLRIRYYNFPGAREIQRDLDVLLQQWQLSESQLFAQTRDIHQSGQIYRRKQNNEVQDWS